MIDPIQPIVHRADRHHQFPGTVRYAIYVLTLTTIYSSMDKTQAIQHNDIIHSQNVSYFVNYTS